MAIGISPTVDFAFKLMLGSPECIPCVASGTLGYFLQNADKLTPEDIRRLFPDEEIAEAAGVLEMISQTPEQLMLYNARLKF